jgi:iron-sulfur cluster assembly protein
MTKLRFSGLTLLIVTCGFGLGCNDRSTPGDSGPRPLPSDTVENSEPKVDTTPIIELSPKAVATINQILSEQGTTAYLRVRVVPGGCCGFLHKLDLDPVVSFEDHTFQSSGIKVVVLKRQIEMLRGTKVDFGFEGDRQGFKVQNPNFEGEASKKWLPVLKKDKRAD